MWSCWGRCGSVWSVTTAALQIINQLKAKPAEGDSRMSRGVHWSRPPRILTSAKLKAAQRSHPSQMGEHSNRTEGEKGLRFTHYKTFLNYIFLKLGRHSGTLSSFYFSANNLLSITMLDKMIEWKKTPRSKLKGMKLEKKNGVHLLKSKTLRWFNIVF